MPLEARRTYTGADGNVAGVKALADAKRAAARMSFAMVDAWVDGEVLDAGGRRREVMHIVIRDRGLYFHFLLRRDPACE